MPGTPIFSSSGIEAENYLRLRYPGSVKRDFQTNALNPAGFRFRGATRFREVDAYDPTSRIGHESKVGYNTDTYRNQEEYLKDAWLVGNQPLGEDPKVTAVSWHFYCSAETGRIGPDPALRAELTRRGISIVVHLGIP